MCVCVCVLDVCVCMWMYCVDVCVCVVGEVGWGGMWIGLVSYPGTQES